MNKVVGLLMLIVLSCMFSSIKAWQQEGHMLVSQIAYDQLDQDTKTKLDGVIKIYETYYPTLSDHFGASVWADAIRADHIYTFGDWHYIDTPYSPTNMSVPRPVDENVVWALKQALTTMTHKPDLWGSAFMIRMLIHLVGDLHQPFHNIALYSSEFPNGDRGGNEFIVYHGSTKTNLHSFWDSIGYTGHKEYKFPLNSEEQDHIISRASSLVSTYGSFSVDQIDFPTWSQESYQLAISQGYNSVQSGQKLTDAYTQNTIKVCEQQIVKAGFRLAQLIQEIFSGGEK